MKPNYTNKRLMKVKLIFNPMSGLEGESPVQLMDILSEMQAWNISPDTFLIGPDCDLSMAVKNALTEGIKMFAVCGGDGTVSAVARMLCGTDAAISIIPTGTQNNIALSLGIPKEIKAAITILRIGRKIKTDVGEITYGGKKMPFIEVCSVGLFSTLFPSGNDILHGNLARVGDFLTTLVTSPPADINLKLENEREINKTGHMVIISNMPYFGSNIKVGCENSYKDGFLDVMFFSDLSKLNLMGYFLRGETDGEQDDIRIKRYKARKINIFTNPPMSVMADGDILGEGEVNIEVWRRALNVMVAPKAREEEKNNE